MKTISGVINVAIIVFLVLVCVKNSGSTTVDFFFAQPTMPLFVLLLLTFVLGMVFGRTLFNMFTKKKK